MGKYTLKNELLEITILSKGAELCSVIKNEVEYIWQANPNIWSRHAPNLFPIVGSVKNKSYFFENQSYELSQHGFARDSEFELVNQSETTISLSLKSNEETITKYPFDFELIINYNLNQETLKIEYLVKNSGSKPMYYQVGGHPGFRVPLLENEQFEDYFIEFNNDSVLDSNQVNLSNGLLSHQTEKIDLSNHQLALSTTVFDKDALVLKSLNSKNITLQSSKSSKGVSLNMGNMPWLGIWSKKDCKEFVCLEPWQGHADFEDTNQDFTTKAGIVSLNPNEEKSSYFELKFL